MTEFLAALSSAWKVLIGTVGYAIAAVIGHAARFAHDPKGFTLRRFFIEVPAVILAAIAGGGIGELLGWPPLTVYALCGVLAYLGPRGIEVAENWLDRGGK